MKLSGRRGTSERLLGSRSSKVSFLTERESGEKSPVPLRFLAWAVGASEEKPLRGGVEMRSGYTKRELPRSQRVHASLGSTEKPGTKIRDLQAWRPMKSPTVPE